MGITVKLRIRELEEFGKSLEALAEAPGRISAALALATLKLIAEGFQKQADPEGRAWAPKVIPDGNRILVKTGRMRASFRIIRANAEGFVVGTSVSYAGFHQSGTRRMPRRGMLPDQGRVPAQWQEVWERTAEEVLQEALG